VLRRGCTERTFHAHWWIFADAPLACRLVAALAYAQSKSRRETAMAVSDYAFCKGLKYPSIVEAWTPWVRSLIQPPLA
jgi:hypothetical protein